jgi:hypothetical protein
LTSIRRKISMLSAVWVLLILVTGLAIVDFTVSGWLQDNFDISLTAKAKALVTLTKFDGNEVEIDFADEFMPEFQSVDQPEYFSLHLESGQLLENSRRFAKTDPATLDSFNGQKYVRDQTLPDGREGRGISILFMPQVEDKTLRASIPMERRPQAVISYWRERGSLNDLLFRIHLLIAVIGLFAFLALILCVVIVIETGLKPLTKMRNEIRQISPDSISSRIDSVNQPEELAPIAVQFNTVLVFVGRMNQTLIRILKISTSQPDT